MKKSLSQTFWNAVSLATDQFGPAFAVKFHDNIGFTLDTAGVTSNTGTFFIEATNENPFDSMGRPKVPAITSWEALDVEPVNILAGADAKFRVDLNQVPFAYIRCHFVVAGSTPNGTVVGRIQAKGI